MKTEKDKEYSFMHVNGRLDERFNLPITMEEFEKLSDSLTTDKSRLVQVENDDQEIHSVRFKGKLITFVYSRERGHITTALINFRKRR